jgi:catechol 2,3-dioxygenase-like lactoylglutathione lyase family enzyme
MELTAIDHLNLRIPEDGPESAVEFYGGRLGLEIEGPGEFETAEKPFFDARIAPESVVHRWPTASFVEPTTDENYDHVAFYVDAGIETLVEELERVGVGIERRNDAPRGARGTAPAVYVRDPFGYRVELKTRED